MQIASVLHVFRANDHCSEWRTACDLSVIYYQGLLLVSTDKREMTMASTPDPWAKVAKRLRSRRDGELHWTQNQLSAIADVSPGTISSLENNKPSGRQYPKVRKLWLALGLPEAELLSTLNGAEVIYPPSGVEQLLATIDVVDLPEALKDRMRTFVAEIQTTAPVKATTPKRRRKPA